MFRLEPVVKVNAASLSFPRIKEKSPKGHTVSFLHRVLGSFTAPF